MLLACCLPHFRRNLQVQGNLKLVSASHFRKGGVNTEQFCLLPHLSFSQGFCILRRLGFICFSSSSSSEIMNFQTNEETFKPRSESANQRCLNDAPPRSTVRSVRSDRVEASLSTSVLPAHTHQINYFLLDPSSKPSTSSRSILYLLQIRQGDDIQPFALKHRMSKVYSNRYLQLQHPRRLFCQRIGTFHP